MLTINQWLDNCITKIQPFLKVLKLLSQLFMMNNDDIVKDLIYNILLFLTKKIV